MHRKAVIYSTNSAGLAITLFSAQRMAWLNPERDFDIVITSLDNLDIPTDFQRLGISAQRLEREPQDEILFAIEGKNPPEVMATLLISRVFRDRYDRIFYVDYDTCPLGGDVARLMDVDMGPHAIGAVRDVAQWRNLSKPVWEFEIHKLENRAYLNAGILLIDTQKFVSQNIREKCIQIRKDGKKCIHMDQSLLNLVLLGKFAELSPVWNWQMTHMAPLSTKHFGARLLHFCGPDKPWISGPAYNAFPRSLKADYREFFATYFPEMGMDLPLGTSGPLRVLSRLGDLKNQAVNHLKIAAYLRRFNDENHVIL